jgi:glycosyltransferase involved in cell wall biosynthesis
MSRIHPVKNLAGLLQAWAMLRPEVVKGWRLRIAGPDEGGHGKEIEALIQTLGLQDSVELIGPVGEDRKAAVYQSADLFVLPSFSENFGVVVAEALTHSLPVITTRGTPWSGLVTNGCGWWIDIGTEPLTQALQEAMSLSCDKRRAMGVRGREYVRQYDWAHIAQQTIEVYRWVLGQGQKPACVQTD